MLFPFLRVYRSRRSNTSGTLLLRGEPLQKRRRGGMKVTGGLSQARNGAESERLGSRTSGGCAGSQLQKRLPIVPKLEGRGEDGAERDGTRLFTQRGSFFRSPSSRRRRTLFAVVNSSLSSCTAVLPVWGVTLLFSEKIKAVTDLSFVSWLSGKSLV